MTASRIPEKFSMVLTASDVVCAEFEAYEPYRPFDDARWIRDIPIINDDDVAHVALMLDTEASLLAIYIIVQMPDAEDKVSALARAVALVNYGLLPGCFELDVESGDIRYRCALPLTTNSIGARDIGQLLAHGLLVTREYANAFQKIVVTDMKPEDAIAEVED